MQSHNHQKPSTGKNRFPHPASPQHFFISQKDLEALEKCIGEDDVAVYVAENYSNTEDFEDKLSFLIKEFKKLRDKNEEDFAKGIKRNRVPSVALTSQTESSSNERGHKIKKDDLFLEPEELGSTLLIPANGGCLYASIFIGYLLPVIDDTHAFEIRIHHLIGNEGSPYPEDTPETWRLQLLNNLQEYQFLRGDFQYWVRLFQNNMELSENLWGGPEEIQQISRNLGIEIQEFIESPEDDEIKNSYVQIHTTISSGDHGPKEILSILRTNPNEWEAIDRSEDEDFQATQAESAVSSGNLQHYRPILTKKLEEKLKQFDDASFLNDPSHNEEENPYKLQPLWLTCTENLKEFLSESSENFIFGAGILAHSLLRSAPKKTILTEKEESDILKAKDFLLKNIHDLKNRKELLRMMFSQQNKEIKFEIKVSKKQRSPRVATPDDIQEMCINLQKKSIEYIQFLRQKFEKLLKDGQYERAESELTELVEHSTKINGENHIETLMIRLERAFVQFNNHDKLELGRTHIEETLKILENELTRFPDNIDYIFKIKESLAMGFYLLAQYHYSNGRIDETLKYLDRSENLRKEYGAPEKELEKIRFLRGRILYDKGDYSAGLEILTNCYNFRKSQGKLNRELIPVLEILISIMEKENKTSQQMILLSQLLDIQKYHQMSERQIITTQLKMLKVFRGEIPQKERLTLIEEIEARLDAVPIQQESIEVGLMYLDLANSRGDFLPSHWSNVRKRDYFSETLKLLAKAEIHLRSISHTPLYENTLKNLHDLKDYYIQGIALFNDMIEDPTRYSLKNDKSHPEDKEEAVHLADEIHEKDESSTKQKLRILSEFSSEVRHSLIDPSDAFLTVEDFENLPTEGVINPFRLRVAQGGIDPAFRDKKSLEDMQQSLVQDPTYATQIPRIKIGIHNGKVYSFNTRRLIVHQKAREENPNVYVRYQKMTPKEVEEVIKIFDSRPWNGFVTALRYGSKNSESIPYINPAVRDQLENTVKRKFKSFPSTRQASDDANGFPILEPKARKIYRFLEERAKKGSTFASEILEETEKIGKSQGREAAYTFLVKTKAKYQDEAFGSLKNESDLEPSISAPRKNSIFHRTPIISNSSNRNIPVDPKINTSE